MTEDDIINTLPKADPMNMPKLPDSRGSGGWYPNVVTFACKATWKGTYHDPSGSILTLSAAGQSQTETFDFKKHDDRFNYSGHYLVCDIGTDNHSFTLNYLGEYDANMSFYIVDEAGGTSNTLSFNTHSE